MDVSEDVTSTLRAEAHHPPCVMENKDNSGAFRTGKHSAGFCTEHSAKSRTIGYEEEKSPTLRAGTVPAAVALDNHPIDSRIKVSENGVFETLTSRMGTGGNNVPLVMKIRSGCEGGGKGPLIQTDKSATLSCNNDQTLFEPKVYGICSKDSNAMKSDNPNSGFYEADTSRTIDGNGGNPSCNQGGMAVVCVDQGGGKSSCNITEEQAPTLTCTHGGEPVVAFTQNQRNEVRDLGEASGALPAQPGMKQQTFVLQGSMIGRAYKNGPQGSGVNEDVSFTLDSVDRHAVAYGIDRAAFNQGINAKYNIAVEEELEPTIVAKGPGAVAEPTYSLGKGTHFTHAGKDVSPTLTATDYKDPPAVNESSETAYIVRRLTPTECARLQGFPDWWCSDLGTENPTDEEIAYWRDVFETHRVKTNSASKPKSDKQLIKWIGCKEEKSLSARFRELFISFSFIFTPELVSGFKRTFDIPNLVYSLKAPYRKNAKFLMNEATVSLIRKLKDGNGNYLWQPSVQAGQPDKILGYDVFTTPFAPTIAGGALAIAFGDFSNYWIGDRGGRTVQRLNELYATNGQVGYVATERVDGKVILPEAIKLLKMKS